MALRLLVHMGRIGVSLSDAGAKRLPVILPVVLYNGESAWTAALRGAARRRQASPRADPRVHPDSELVIDDVLD
jgi:hypothetical protein